MIQYKPLFSPQELFPFNRNFEKPRRIPTKITWEKNFVSNPTFLWKKYQLAG